MTDKSENKSQARRIERPEPFKPILSLFEPQTELGKKYKVLLETWWEMTSPDYGVGGFFEDPPIHVSISNPPSQNKPKQTGQRLCQMAKKKPYLKPKPRPKPKKGKR